MGFNCTVSCKTLIRTVGGTERSCVVAVDGITRNGSDAENKQGGQQDYMLFGKFEAFRSNNGKHYGFNGKQRNVFYYCDHCHGISFSQYDIPVPYMDRI